MKSMSMSKSMSKKRIHAIKELVQIFIIGLMTFVSIIIIGASLVYQDVQEHLYTEQVAQAEVEPDVMSA